MATPPPVVASRFAHLAGAKPATAADDDVKTDEKIDDNADDKTTDEEVVDKLDELEERIEDLEETEDEDDADDEKVASAARVSKAAAAGRRAERARCAAIFAAPIAASSPALAAQLAFGTDLAPKAAIGVMAAAVASAKPAARRGLGDRMAQAPALRVGGGDAAAPGRDTHEGAAAFVLGAAAKSRGDLRDKTARGGK